MVSNVMPSGSTAADDWRKKKKTSHNFGSLDGGERERCHFRWGWLKPATVGRSDHSWMDAASFATPTIEREELFPPSPHGCLRFMYYVLAHNPRIWGITLMAQGRINWIFFAVVGEGHGEFPRFCLMRIALLFVFRATRALCSRWRVKTGKRRR